MSYNILTIAPTSFFADYGCHVRILEEIRTLQRLGNTVTVCTYHNGDDLPGVEIKRSLDVPWRKGVQVGSSRHKLYFDAMLSTKTLRVALRRKPDLIHAHLHEGALIGYPISRLLRIPLVFDFQGSMTAEMIDHHFLKRGSLFHPPLRWLESRINEMAGAIITSSHNGARILREDFHLPPEKIYPVPDAVDTERFKPRFDPEAEEDKINLKRQLGIPLNRQIVVYLGLLANYQGTDLLLEAARHLLPTVPDLHFVIMGYPGVDSYRELAEYLGLAGHVAFPGRIPYEQAPRYLSLGDVAVSPKMSVTEGSGK
ncbi:MAG: glycosyltransferase family 4 protein, partial [Chloroflexi bacterium]|nr:glycosyltransferase family 4 protein [Chloroflexota bacterium]